MHVNTSECIETKKDFTRSREIPVKRPGGGFEQPISRILSLRHLATTQVAIIYLGVLLDSQVVLVA